jgi:hypothetical protein
VNRAEDLLVLEHVTRQDRLVVGADAELSEVRTQLPVRLEQLQEFGPQPALGANDPAASVAYTRLDTSSTTGPQRFVSSIAIDAGNPNHAWLSYSGYNFNTPAQPGHVFEVTRAGALATWTDLTYNLADLPVTDLVRDDLTGDLYAATDFGVMKLASGATSWTVAAAGMPMVEVPGLTIVPGARVLYAATHGLGAWSLDLGKVKH